MIIIQNMTFMIKLILLLDAGDYTCWSGDQQSKSAKLTVYAQPGVPHIRSCQRYWRLCWTFAVISDRKLWNECFTHHAQQNHGLKDRQARNGGSLEATRNVLLQLDCESLVGFSAIVWNIFWQTKSSGTINIMFCTSREVVLPLSWSGAKMANGLLICKRWGGNFLWWFWLIFWWRNSN